MFDPPNRPLRWINPDQFDTHQNIDLTEEGCVRTLSSYDPNAYLYVQIIYLGLGGVTTLASAVMYIRSLKYEASKLQQYNFLIQLSRVVFYLNHV
ncbi:hypothetical protein PF005_g11778 [Phytophthora fragariae]|uniref:Uncharacterized protein n=1 Tax=Phytophthora fragariae TaxID=53985 RepID=A0A6A3XWT6_9STRA|nr:hypothetical protein PF005_g11778 [Phytophthora fragariae]KAE9229816.1 hypothetical protein PF002_g13213 [Phytophthora fragariae]